jgi:hypothetical protein
MDKDQELIYHVVDEVVVPKPGNQRTPGRAVRMEVNVAAGTNRTIELTDAEQADFDERARKHEEERPIREAQARQQKAAAEEYRASLHYEQRLVAFVDVLGWRSAVERSVADPEQVQKLGLALTVMQGHGKMLDSIRERFPNSARLSQFSDSIIVSAQLTAEGFSELLNGISFLSRVFPWQGLWLRGGITVGPVYHNNNIAFGPAIVEAYELESKKADAPRIILSDSAVGWIVEHARFGGFSDEGTWRRLGDEHWFLDFLQPITKRTFLDSEKPLQQSIDGCKHHFEMIRKPIAHGLATFTDTRIKAKYLWLAQYFNAIVAEYPEARVDPF